MVEIEKQYNFLFLFSITSLFCPILPHQYQHASTVNRKSLCSTSKSLLCPLSFTLSSDKTSLKTAMILCKVKVIDLVIEKKTCTGEHQCGTLHTENFIVIVTLGRRKHSCAFLCFLDGASTLTESDWH